MEQLSVLRSIVRSMPRNASGGVRIFQWTAREHFVNPIVTSQSPVASKLLLRYLFRTIATSPTINSIHIQ